MDPPFPCSCSRGHFEIFSFGVVIIVILLYFLTSEVFDLLEGCTFIFSKALDFVWSTSDSIFRSMDSAAIFALR